MSGDDAVCGCGRIAFDCCITHNEFSILWHFDFYSIQFISIENIETVVRQVSLDHCQFIPPSSVFLVCSFRMSLSLEPNSRSTNSSPVLVQIVTTQIVMVDSFSILSFSMRHGTSNNVIRLSRWEESIHEQTLHKRQNCCCNNPMNRWSVLCGIMFIAYHLNRSHNNTTNMQLQYKCANRTKRAKKLTEYGSTYVEVVYKIGICLA